MIRVTSIKTEAGCGMQVECAFDREQVCAVVDAHNRAKPMGKERKPADYVQLSIESIS